MGLRDGAWRWLAGWVVAAPAWALAPLDLTSPAVPVLLAGAAQAWIEPEGRATVEDIADSTAVPWQLLKAGSVQPLRPGQALWIRFTARAAQSERWYLELPYPHVDRVAMYVPDPLGQWSPQFAGDTLPVASWPVPHRHPLLPLALDALEPRTYLLRVENAHGFSAPLRLVSESYLGRTEQRHSLVQGMYFGLVGLATALALAAAVSLRDGAFARFALAVALLGLSQTAMTGIAGLHLWPRAADWNNASVTALPMLFASALLWFFASVVSLAERSPRLHTLVLVLAVAGVVAGLGVASPMLDAAQRVRLGTFYLGAASVAAFAALAWAAQRGDRFAGWILAGSIPVMLAGAVAMARSWGLVPLGFWTQYGMQVAAAIELPVLLVVLTRRTQQRREHQRRVAGLDRVDPATGLINGQVFVERLIGTLARAERLHHRSAVLLVDIANVEQIRRHFDRRSAEELPLRVAGRLMAAAREIDSVARLSEHRFGLLMEGPLTPDEVSAAGPRLVARCLMPFEGKPLDWVAQVRVAQCMVPVDGGGAAEVLQRLEALLAAVPPDSKRAVFTLAPR